jgi:hypothetical protein
MRLLFIPFIFCISFPLLGQSDFFQPGFLVLATGDTLKGDVMDRRETFTGIEILGKIRLKTPKGKVKRYSRSVLNAYRSGEYVYKKFRIEPVRQVQFLTNYYQVVPFGGEVAFLREVKVGTLSMYEYEWTDDMGSEVERFPLFIKKNENLMVRATQGIFGLKRKILIDYFSDCPDLAIALADGRFSLPQEIVMYYNHQCR